MNKIYSFVLSCLFLSSQTYAFILIDPSYSLANPTDVVINISSDNCVGNGISDATLTEYLEEAVKDYWNTVPESLLYIKVEGAVSTSLSAEPSAGQILVGCAAISSSGVANMNIAKNGCRLRLDSGTFVPGGYTRQGIMGVIIHELGHCVGLHHSKDKASVMTYETKPWIQAKQLSRDDKDAVTYLYPYESKAKIFGSCSIIASDGQRPNSKEQIYSFLLTLLFGISLAISLRYLISKKS